MQINAVYFFGEYRLDTANAQLLKHERDVPLPPKAFMILTCLVERRGMLVTKQELLDAVWEHRYVTEGVLKSTMQIVRQALEDDAKTPRFLETVHRRGYRFIADVLVMEGEAAAPQIPDQFASLSPDKVFLSERPSIEQQVRPAVAASPYRISDNRCILPLWSSAAVTKFRTPKLRATMIPREALLKRLQTLTSRSRVTLVCAPAGFGKTTLLAQFAAQSELFADTVWLSLDDDDNDPNRLFVSLVSALHETPLTWQVDPHILASRVDSDGPGARAAVAGLVNALCSYRGERLLLIADDLHLINDKSALRLLDDLVDRLPSEIRLLLGARVDPALSLPRWRARGELGELLASDLQFNETDAVAFAKTRFDGTVSPEFVRQAVARTQGWAAGLQLIFGAVGSGAPWGSEMLIGRSARHLFDYFAAEVLAGLPQDLHDFLLHCAVLPELDPERCAAVAGRSDARLVLEELYRRNLFLTVLDDRAPVLRLHDLFRDYLQGELELHDPELAVELHARAAAAEPVSPRAVTHWLKAQRWEDAAEEILRCADVLMAEGGYTLIERWISKLPETISQQRPEMAYLLGMCHWARYDFLGMREPLELACAGYRRRGDRENLAKTLFMLGRSLQSTGDLAACARLLDEVDSFESELDLNLRSAFHAVRAWQALADGRPQYVAPALQAIVAVAEQDLTTLYPAVCDVFNSFFYGMPGALAPLRRLRELCAIWESRQAVHWQIEAMANTAWPNFWCGGYEDTKTALVIQTDFLQHMNALPPLWINLHQLKCWVLSACGDFEQAVKTELRNLQIVDAVEFSTLAPTWRRPIILNVAAAYWVAQDVSGLSLLAPELQPARWPEEWPVVDTGRSLVLGQLALLEGRLDEAEAQLLQAKKLYQRWRLPTFMGNPSASLALLRLAQGNPEAAWIEFAPVLDDAIVEDCIGPLLLEPREPLSRLLALIPLAEQERYQRLLIRLAGWNIYNGSKLTAQAR